MKFFNKRVFLTIAGIFILIVLILAGGLVLYINSDQFNERARAYIVQQIEERTGGRASLERLAWSLRDQRFSLENLTVRGNEPEDGPPLAHIESIRAGIRLRSLLQRRVDLFELIINGPEFYVTVDQQGRTNLPTPPARSTTEPFNLQISIDTFQILNGIAEINERRVALDLGVRNLRADLNYRQPAGVLSMNAAYDGELRRANRPVIPYSLSGEFDYTRGTLLAHRMDVRSGNSRVQLQGRINDVLTSNIQGSLEYTGDLDVQFLNYFFEREELEGTATAAGSLEFSKGYFFTKGNAAAESVTLEGWNAQDFEGEYSYHYPGRRLALHRVETDIAGGTAAGNISVENIPGRAWVDIDLRYRDIDSTALTRAYPWDPKYKIYSRMTGTIDGWFEGKFRDFLLQGNVSLQSSDPRPGPGEVALPITGSTAYHATPGQVRVTNADLAFFATQVKADGLIDDRNSDLRAQVTSSNLANLYFIYGNANGSGSFDGVLTGPIRTPLLDGSFVLENHRHQGLTIERASGGVRLDTLTEIADLRDVQVVQGESQALITGTASLDGTNVDLQIESAQVRASDIASIVKRDFDGVFSGSVRVTSLDPVRLQGNIRAANLALEGHRIGNAAARISYQEPLVELDNLVVSDNGANLTGSASYNQQTEALRFTVRVNSLPLDRLRGLGFPETVGGVVQQAQFTGSGTRRRPDVQGEAVVQNLSVRGETFPAARLQVRTTGSLVNVTLAAASNLDLTAQIDTSRSGYPFTAEASFDRYSVERLAGFTQGTLTVSGNADVAGSLTDADRLRGSGSISAAQVRIQNRLLTSNRPFAFDFNSDRLNLTGVSLTGEGTQVTVAGTVGLTEVAPLDFDVSGRVDLGLLAAADPEWVSSGTLNVDGRVGGTARNPDLRGLAHFTDASLGRRGIFTTLAELNGDVFFDQNRITLNNLRGQVGGGTIDIQGTGVLRNNQVEAMNVRMETNDVRIRYPEGLRTVVDGTLVLRGSWTAPLLEGDLEIQSMAYRSAFEEFLTLFQTADLEDAPTALGRLGLAIHVEGGRNISIQNELADVEARVNLDIRGTVDRPALTGHVEASGGTLLFQGTRYEITRGNIDFVDPLRIDPIVDIQAESELRDYRVILAISGRGDRLRLDMRSDPPLPQLEIVSLIAGGKTSEELALETARTTGGRLEDLPSSERLFQGGAASILFDLLRSRVGNRFGLLGLDRVRIDPFLVGAENNPSARVTLSEQVTKDLSITYSQDLSSTEQQIIQIEYFITSDVSIIASRDETGALGLDVRRRQRF